MKSVSICVEKACDRLNYSHNYLRFLKKPARSIIVNLPVRMDDGSLEMMKGNWVLHSKVLGPGKGGFRMDLNTSLEDLTFLAKLMTYKCSVVGLPLGGCKANVQVDHRLLSKDEKMRAVRTFTRDLINVLGPKESILAPDLNTNATMMAVMMDTYSVSLGKTTHGVCTGKPLEVGGIVGRNRAVGWGLAHIMNNYVQRIHETMKNKRVVIQGVGHVGKNIARSAVKYGSKVIAISDTSTGLYREEGLEIDKILEHKKKHGHLKGFEGAQEISNEKMLCLDCDALVPCATQNQITKKIAENLSTELIIEGANSPIDYQGEKVVNERNIAVIPDIIANSGGVIVSYFEWVQDLQALQWTKSQVSQQLEKIILRAFKNVYEVRHSDHLTYRDAAYQIALQRLIKALDYRGIYP